MSAQPTDLPLDLTFCTKLVQPCPCQADVLQTESLDSPVEAWRNDADTEVLPFSSPRAGW